MANAKSSNTEDAEETIITLQLMTIVNTRVLVSSKQGVLLVEKCGSPLIASNVNKSFKLFLDREAHHYNANPLFPPSKFYIHTIEKKCLSSKYF